MRDSTVTSTSVAPTRTLPEVGAPGSLVVMALVGLLILSVGVLALLASRR